MKQANPMEPWESKRCGAKTRAGTPCQKWAMLNGSGRCMFHGGKSPRGLAHYNYKDGRYSKYLPARMLGRYQEAKADTELLALRSEIALVDARIADLLGRVDTGESCAIWSDLDALRLEFETAQRREDKGSAALAISRLLLMIKQGKTDFAFWSDILDLIEQRRRLVGSEHKRLVAMQQMVTTEEATMLVSAVVASLRERVFEHCDKSVGRALLNAITSDVAGLLGRPAPAGARR